jgi:hypothetical protein
MIFYIVYSNRYCQAISIFLKSSRMSPADIARLLLSLDARFTADFAELLLAALPVQEELEAVQVPQTHTHIHKS